MPDIVLIKFIMSSCVVGFALGASCAFVVAFVQTPKSDYEDNNDC